MSGKKTKIILYVIVGTLFVLAGLITFFKINYLGYSFDNKDKVYYQVDCTINFEPMANESINILSAMPKVPKDYFLSVVENKHLASEIIEVNNVGYLQFTLTPRSEISHVTFRYLVVPSANDSQEKTLLSPNSMPKNNILSDDIRLKSSEILQKIDAGSTLSTQKLVSKLLLHLGSLPRDQKRDLSLNANSKEENLVAAINILQSKGVPARIVKGIWLSSKKINQQPDNYLDVWFDGAWHLFRPNTGEESKPDKFLILQRNNNAIYNISGVKRSWSSFSVTAIPASANRLNQLRLKKIGGKFSFDKLSLLSLSSSEQNLFKALALFPLAILLIVLLRNVVGLSTMGTFMPVLIALSFLDVKLLPAIISFVLILSVGLVIRSWLSYLNLLMVPRVAAVVVVVIFLMQLISIGANLLGYSDFSEATLFPIIIVAWMIERSSTTWEEEGASNTLKQLISSALAATICYLVLSSPYLQYILYTFGEFNLILLGIILLTGAYTGYRLSELIRFQPLVQDEDTKL